MKIEDTSESKFWNSKQFVFIVCPSRILLNCIENKVLATCFYLFTCFYTILENKKECENSLSATFTAWFLKKKYLSRSIKLADQI